MSLVSIIVPVYNTENYLCRCIDSILSQTYENIEVILIDDGSRDSSPSICDSYADHDSRIRVFHLENGGVSAARNYGMSVMRGDYFIFLDSDDWLESNTVSSALELIERAETDIGVYNFIFEQSNGPQILQIPDGKFTVYELFKDKDTVLITNSFIASPCNKIYRTSIVRENNINFKIGVKFAEDFIFNLTYLQYSETLAVANRPYYHYDCTREGSAIKRMYEDFDIFIFGLRQALQDLVVKINVSDPDTVVHAIVDSRWDFAINICLNCNLPDIEKARTLFRWISAIPSEYLKAVANDESTFGALCQRICKEDCINEKKVLLFVKEHKRTEKRKEFVLRIKRLLRGIR